MSEWRKKIDIEWQSYALGVITARERRERIDYIRWLAEQPAQPGEPARVVFGVPGGWISGPDGLADDDGCTCGLRPHAPWCPAVRGEQEQ